MSNRIVFIYNPKNGRFVITEEMVSMSEAQALINSSKEFKDYVVDSVEVTARGWSQIRQTLQHHITTMKIAKKATAEAIKKSEDQQQAIAEHKVAKEKERAEEYHKASDAIMQNETLSAGEKLKKVQELKEFVV